MPITEATIRIVKFPPELLPDSWFGALAANAEVAPPILDLRRFSPYLVELTNIQLTPLAALNPNVRIRYDDVRVEQNVAAMLGAIPILPAGWPVAGWVAGPLPLPGAWRLPAKSQLYFNLFGLGIVAAYSTHYGVWAYPPTIAHKLLWGIALNDKEKAINQELGIADTVEKGLLPLPISQLIEREYHVVGEETHTRNINIAVPATIYPVEVLYAKPDEILVLTRIAAFPGTAVQNIQLIVDRDNDANYLTFPTFPLSLVAGGEVACFIPALTQLRLTTTATVAPGPNLFRYTVQRVKLSNILRVRFGILPEAEAPKDLWAKCAAGVV
jgi:hypothetical protein